MGCNVSKHDVPPAITVEPAREGDADIELGKTPTGTPDATNNERSFKLATFSVLSTGSRNSPAASCHRTVSVEQQAATGLSEHGSLATDMTSREDHPPRVADEANSVGGWIF